MRLKHILITNDDGYESKGLEALKEALNKIATVTVVAPSAEKSACGHSLTLTRPLRFIEVDKDFYKLDDGTPTDCIYLALHALFKDKKLPDLVISGINKGSNMGEDITYSGTAGAAMEAVLQGIPAIAISQVYKDGVESIKNYGYGLAQKYAYKIAKKILNEISFLKEENVVAVFNGSKEAKYFAFQKNIKLISQKRPLTPEHVIRIKRIPVILKKYNNGQIPLNPLSNVAIIKNKGVLCFGSTKKELI